MRYRVIVLTLAGLGAGLIGCRSKNATDPETSDVQIRVVKSDVQEEPLVPDEEPLLLEEEPLLLAEEPLLLEEPAFDDGGWDMADNSRCHVCHMNYQQEAIAVTHAKHDIGCKDCHGVSDEHIADESWASGGPGTAPDRMFPRDTINPFCMGCHSKDRIDRPEHAAVFKTGDDQKVCTDCHGEHRLHVRRCKWK